MQNADDGNRDAQPVETISPLEAAFERRRRAAGLLLAPLAFAVVYMASGGLGSQGQTMASILAAVVVLWICETLPLPATALFGAVLCIALGVAPAKQVFSYFADPIVFLFIGSFMLARAMAVHGLDRRIALSFLSIPAVSATPARMLAGLGFVTAALSMWVSNTATTAMMMPIGIGILAALHRTRGDGGALGSRPWPFATGMMLMISYAACIGGIGTPVGSPPNLIGIGMIRNAVGVDISFPTWMALAVPMLIAMAAVLFLLLYRLHPETPATASSKASAGSLGTDMREHVAHEQSR